MLDQIISILNQLNVSFDKIIPIGHLQLGRNQVFSVLGKQNFIFKIYGKEIKYLYEKKALHELQNFENIPQIKAFGDKPFKWILMTSIEGVLLENIWETLSFSEKREILHSAGRLLGLMHSKKNSSYFGGWEDINPESIEHEFLKYRQKNDLKIIEKIRDQKLPDSAIFEKAYKELNALVVMLDPCIGSSICHRDFSFRNMIAEKKENKYQFKGLIDFEHCHMDDPFLDFSLLYLYKMLFPANLEKAFFDGYEICFKKPENFEIKKRYYLINLGLHTCSWTYSTAPDFYRSGIEILENMLY